MEACRTDCRALQFDDDNIAYRAVQKKWPDPRTTTLVVLALISCAWQVACGDGRN